MRSSRAICQPQLVTVELLIVTVQGGHQGPVSNRYSQNQLPWSLMGDLQLALAKYYEKNGRYMRAQGGCPGTSRILPHSAALRRAVPRSAVLRRNQPCCAALSRAVPRSAVLRRT
jgi:hypothetical protein